MQFLCLGYYCPEAFERLSPEEQAAVVDACRPHDEKLRASGLDGNSSPGIGSLSGLSLLLLRF